jgi:hypothetical protein
MAAEAHPRQNHLRIGLAPFGVACIALRVADILLRAVVADIQTQAESVVLQNPVAIVLIIAIGCQAVPVAQIVKHAGLPEALPHQMALARRVLATVEEDIQAGRQAAIHPFAAAADRADNFGTGLEGNNRGRHLAIQDILNVLVDRIDRNAVAEDSYNQDQRRTEQDGLQTPEQHRPQPGHEILTYGHIGSALVGTEAANRAMQCLSKD